MKKYSDYEDFCRRMWKSLGFGEPHETYFCPMYYKDDEEHKIWWYNDCDMLIGLQRLEKYKKDKEPFFDFESFLDGKTIIMSLF